MLLLGLECAYLYCPIAPLAPGNAISVFIDYKFNRKTIYERESVFGIVVYDRVIFPSSYMNRFYSVGYLRNGEKVICTTVPKMIKLIRCFEFIRGTLFPNGSDITSEADKDKIISMMDQAKGNVNDDEE